ncbi:helix-turn-helix domain-containing protein [Kiritimatiella glycovorans]|uniref:helix-turn-helix domain-containing protein n=1 Tax=Kiritimatiella glycovorans TaxID=1307763 RepID=UPI00093AF294
MRSEQLGNLIVFHRKKAGLTQVGLAELAGVSRSVVQDLEAGKGRTVWEHVESILVVLNLELQPVGPLVEEWKRSWEVSQ